MVAAIQGPSGLQGGSSPRWRRAEGSLLGRRPEERDTGRIGKQEESAGWEDLQAVGTAATPPQKSKVGRQGAAPAVPRERSSCQTMGQEAGRGAGVSRE